MAVDWISLGNELLVAAMRRQGLTSRAVAMLVTGELRRLGIDRRVIDSEVGHLVNNRRTLSVVATAVAMERLFGIPPVAWVPGAAGRGAGAAPSVLDRASGTREARH